MLYSLGAGRFKRGPETYKRPEPSVPRRWVKKSNRQISWDGTSNPFVIVSYTETDPNTHYTTLATIFWQIGGTIVSEGTTYQTCNWDEIFTGKMDELLGLDPETIVGAWISPIAPQNVTASLEVVHGSTKAAFKCGIYSESAATTLIDLVHAVGTDDNQKIVFYDITGTEMYTVPWGIEFRYINAKVDVGSTGANLMIYLEPLAGHWLKEGYEGRLFEFPLPSLPVTDNAWSSYNYTGEREYDIRARQIQRDQAGVNGVAGIGTSAIGGAIAGSIVPGVGTAVGAAAGLISGALGTGVNYLTSGEFDRQAQEAVDKLKSSQNSALILTARGITGLEPSGIDPGWNMVVMERDAVSAAELTAEQSELGFVTDTYAADCSAIVALGGGVRIEGLEVRGDIPKEGRAYIAALFARGVHLDIIN